MTQNRLDLYSIVNRGVLVKNSIYVHLILWYICLSWNITYVYVEIYFNSLYLNMPALMELFLSTNSENKVGSTMLFLITAFVSELLKGMPRKQKLLGDSVFMFLSCILSAIFTAQTHTWLSGVSPWTYRCRQQRQVGGKQHSKHKCKH